MTTGTEGNDNLTNDRNVQNEVVNALGGDDTITVLPPNFSPVASVTVNGGGGSDTLIAGGTFRGTNSPSGNDGQITIRHNSQLTYTIDYTSIERLELTGSLMLTTAPYRFTTGASVDILRFTPSVAGMTAEVWTGGGNDQVYLSGAFGNAVAVTEAGNDLLSFYDLTAGSVGAYGGMGDDTYEIGNVLVVVYEGENWGTDTVRTNRTDYTLTAHVENLVGTLDARQVLTGNGLANRITGNAGVDTLSGLGGDDVLTGNQGADGLDGGSGSDTADYSAEGGALGVVVNLGASPVAPDGHPTFGRSVVTNEAIDTYGFADVLTSIENVRSGAGNDYLYGSAGDNRFESGGGNDRLEGGGGHDWLDGGTGADTMIGGTGNDIYFVDNAGDVVTENAGEGTDEVRTSLAAYSLAGTSIENLLGSGSAAQTLSGSEIANVIGGSSGNDTIYGAYGGDTLTGGAGADTFVYKHVYDSFLAFPIDRILDFTPGTDKIDLEQIDISVAEGDQDFSFIGTAPFSGAAGQLRVAHQGGNQYRVEGDLDGNTSPDFAITVTTTNGQPLTASDFLGVAGQTLNGDGGNNTLAGGSGNDTLYGAGGGDTLTGGGGSDTFLYKHVYDSFLAYPIDQIMDFTPGTDRIDLSQIDTMTAAGDQGFTYIGTAAFSANGTPAQLRVASHGGNKWKVEADLDGNGTADFAIWVTTTNGQPLTSADFIP